MRTIATFAILALLAFWAFMAQAGPAMAFTDTATIPVHAQGSFSSEDSGSDVSNGGGLFEAIFFGKTYTGINQLDIALFCALVFVAFMVLSPGKRLDNDQDDSETGPREASDAYKRAARMWDYLSNKPESGNSQSPPPSPDFERQHGPDVIVDKNIQLPPGFNTAEFLEGAKLVYSRLHDSLSHQDFEDLRHFTTDAMRQRFTNKYKSNPPRTNLLLVNAQLTDITQDQSHQSATVLYETIQSPKNSKKSIQSKEIWRFKKDLATPDALWLLEDTQAMQ